MITLEAYLTASGKYPERATHPELTNELKANAIRLLAKLNPFLDELGVKNPIVSSGFRPSDVNAVTPGAAKKSNHTLCRAIDIFDPKGNLDTLLVKNNALLEKYGLYVEDNKSTPTWAHIQNVSPKSGKRFFIP